MEHTISELERLLYDFGTKYIREVIYTDGKVRQEVIDEASFKIMKSHHDRKTLLPETVKVINYYKIRLDKNRIGSGIKVEVSLSLQFFYRTLNE